jgi:hypothetical protein
MNTNLSRSLAKLSRSLTVAIAPIQSEWRSIAVRKCQPYNDAKYCQPEQASERKVHIFRRRLALVCRNGGSSVESGSSALRYFSFRKPELDSVEDSHENLSGLGKLIHDGRE